MSRFAFDGYRDEKDDEAIAAAITPPEQVGALFMICGFMGGHILSREIIFLRGFWVNATNLNSVIGLDGRVILSMCSDVVTQGVLF